MTDQDRRRVQACFDEAVGLTAGERQSYLERHCPPHLRDEVESLLAADQSSARVLERPLLGTWVLSKEDRSLRGYEIGECIGEGASSRVFRALRTDGSGRAVAIKYFRYPVAGDEVGQRWEIERRALGSLRHPNIAALLDGGVTKGGRPYLVLELVEGVPIDEYCKLHGLTARERIELFLPVCRAVHYAHQNLIVHRDLKPSNILVDQRGTPKLLDFGIAKLLGPESDGLLTTATAMRPMTPMYASPEQFRGDRITTATDVYSLGVVLCRVITGSVPYSSAGTRRELERVVTTEPPLRPSSLLSDDRRRRIEMTGDFDNIILMALRKEPDRRYGSPLALADDLQRYLEGRPVRAHRDSLAYLAGKFIRRHSAVVAGLAAALVLLVGFLVTLALQATRLAEERDEAQRQRDKAQAGIEFLNEVFQLSNPNMQSDTEAFARMVLDRSVERVVADLAAQPDMQAALLHAAGVVFRNIGLPDRSAELLEQAVARAGEAHGQDHHDVVAYRRSLGLVRAAQGDYEEAARLLGEVLSSQERMEQPDPNALAQTRYALGTVLRDLADYDAAQPLLEQALEHRRRTHGDDDPGVAEALGALARLHLQRGQLAEAEEGFVEALRIARLVDDSGPLVFMALDDLAVLELTAGRFDAAEAHFKEVLGLGEKLYSPGHPMLIDALNDLGVLYGMQGRLDESETLLRDVLDRRRMTLGERHPAVAESWVNLGRLLKERGQFDEAERCYRTGLDIYRESFGDVHATVAQTLNNLGVLLLERGRHAEAEPHMREALNVRLALFGTAHPDTANSYARLGRLYMETDRLEQAEESLRTGLEIIQRSLPEGHWRVGDLMSDLGACLLARGRPDEAAGILATARQILASQLGEDHPDTQLATERLTAARAHSG